MNELAEKLAPASALSADDFGDLREQAQRALMQHGFPDLKTEAWKYTPIKLLEKREFQTGNFFEFSCARSAIRGVCPAFRQRRP